VPGLLSGADGRGQLTGAAGRLIVLGALRPSYSWLYQMHSSTIIRRYRDLHDPDGFAALDRLCEATPRFTVTDRQLAYVQLTRVLIHNGGRLGDITVDDWLQLQPAQPLVCAAARRRRPAGRGAADHLGGQPPRPAQRGGTR
jgi:hypothetical protein